MPVGPKEQQKRWPFETTQETPSTSAIACPQTQTPKALSQVRIILSLTSPTSLAWSFQNKGVGEHDQGEKRLAKGIFILQLPTLN